MTKRLGSSNRRRGRKAKRASAADRPGNILRTEIDAAVATAFKPVSPPPPKEAVAAPAEVAPDTLPGIEPPGFQLSQLSTKDSKLSAEPLPARMLNEFVYCPRLFYYEFVEGVFVHNADTLRGAAIHTRVDSGSGVMPPAEGGLQRVERGQAFQSETEEPEMIHSRSVSLGSDRLGVTAKIDLVEVRGSAGASPAVVGALADEQSRDSNREESLDLFFPARSRPGRLQGRCAARRPGGEGAMGRRQNAARSPMPATAR